MESATYGSSHLPSPALVVFSQAAGGLGEALRIQRPFHSQVGANVPSENAVILLQVASKVYSDRYDYA